MSAAYRLFVAGPDGVDCHDVSFEMDAAMDVLADAGMLDEARARLLLACESDPDGPFGGNPEHLARKMARLGRALKER